jgi:hypothetical protein
METHRMDLDVIASEKMSGKILYEMLDCETRVCLAPRLFDTANMQRMRTGRTRMRIFHPKRELMIFYYSV